MKIDSNNTINSISSSQVLLIRNTLRSLGLCTGHIGTRLLNKAIQILTIKDLEIVVLEDIYQEIAIYFPNLTPHLIRMNIYYALARRDVDKSISNFKSIFGFEYDDFYFEPKNFIEEMANIIRINSFLWVQAWVQNGCKNRNNTK